MAIHKAKRHPAQVDMTPMVDLGFLLVTFFMMTTQFQPADLVTVSIPAASSESKLPESNTATVLISKDGQVYFRMDGTRNLRSLGKNLNSAYNLGMTDREIEKFATQTGFGVPFSGLKEYLNLSETEQKNMTPPGIPLSTTQNELSAWLMYGRISNLNARFVIKADKATPYPVIKKVMDTLQDQNISRFSLITDTEKKIETTL